MYVIGNIHDSVPNYHLTILFDILNKIKPDIILHEVDSLASLRSPTKSNKKIQPQWLDFNLIFSDINQSNL